MKISRIALASLISFGVLGGASLNASASHHSHYNKVLWNKPMAHKKVALKNGKGIIWNKPFKTAKNAKIKYRISHKKGLVLTTIRHMKVKNGTIYYFVKAGKVTGWINKKSIKLVKATAAKTVTEPTRTTPATQAPQATTPSTQANAAESNKSGTNGTVTQGSAGTLGTLPSTSSNASTEVNDPFNKSAEGTEKDGAWVYHQKVNGDTVTDQTVAFHLEKGAKVIAALNTDKNVKDPQSGEEMVLIRIQTQYGYVTGYVKRSEVNFEKDDKNTVPVLESVSTSALPAAYNDAFSTYTDATLSEKTWLTHQKWEGSKLVTSAITTSLPEGTKLQVAGNDSDNGHGQLLVRVPDKGIWGYVDISTISFGQPEKQSVQNPTGNTKTETPSTPASR